MASLQIVAATDGDKIVYVKYLFVCVCVCVSFLYVKKLRKQSFFFMKREGMLLSVSHFHFELYFWVDTVMCAKSSVGVSFPCGQIMKQSSVNLTHKEDVVACLLYTSRCV